MLIFIFWQLLYKESGWWRRGWRGYFLIPWHVITVVIVVPSPQRPSRAVAG
jgi:hypothetical protein